jgi:hypothetical protein
MNFLRSLATDLRERQIFPAVVLLVLLAIAIPVYASVELSKSSTPSAIAVAPVNSAPPKGTPPPDQETATVTSAPTQPSAVYKGQEPNPFRSYGAPASSAATSGTSTTTTTPATTTTTTTPSTTTPTTTTTPKTSTPSGTPTPTIAPAPSNLKDDEAYTVDVTTTYAGQKDELSDLQRLTPLPANIPEVVYLGVMAGGKKAAFLLGGAKFEQDGSSNVDCLPSLSDCQVIELAPGHGFYLAASSAQPGVSKLTFILNDISFEKYSSAASATDARKSASPTGEQFFAASTSTELANFFYDVSTGSLLYTPAPSGGTGSSGATAGTGTTGTSGSSGATGATGATNGPAVFAASTARAFKSSSR